MNEQLPVHKMPYKERRDLTVVLSGMFVFLQSIVPCEDSVLFRSHTIQYNTIQYNTIQYNNFYLNTINVLSVAACGVVYDSRLINSILCMYVGTGECQSCLI